MATYYTGTVTSLTDLLTALKNHCVTEGWALDGTDVLYKDTCQVEVNITASMIRIRGGTGHGSGALTGANSFYGYIGTASPANSATVLFLTFPLNYELYIFDNPKEVYLVVPQGDGAVQMLCFGQSEEPGLPGNGTWFYATMGSGVAISFGNTTPIACVPGYSSSGTSSNNNVAWPCMFNQHHGDSRSCSIHHNYDGIGWAPGSQTGERRAWATNGVTGWLRFQDPLLERQPSGIGEGAPLIPIDVFCGRPDNNITPVLGLQHIRSLRIDNLDPGQLITYGPDTWKVYPWFKKDMTLRNGSVTGTTHTGTMGWALRYQGP